METMDKKSIKGILTRCCERLGLPDKTVESLSCLAAETWDGEEGKQYVDSLVGTKDMLAIGIATRLEF